MNDGGNRDNSAFQRNLGPLDERELFMRYAGMTALWTGRHVCQWESGDMSPHSEIADFRVIRGFEPAVHQEPHPTIIRHFGP